jgi:hypothetical protein
MLPETKLFVLGSSMAGASVVVGWQTKSIIPSIPLAVASAFFFYKSLRVVNPSTQKPNHSLGGAVFGAGIGAFMTITAGFFGKALGDDISSVDTFVQRVQAPVVTPSNVSGGTPTITPGVPKVATTKNAANALVVTDNDDPTVFRSILNADGSPNDGTVAAVRDQNATLANLDPDPTVAANQIRAAGLASH